MQRLDRFLHSPLFEEAYPLLQSSPITKGQLPILIDQGDFIAVKELCEAVVEREVGEYNIHELRKLARSYAIPYYTTYSKAELLSIIIEWRKRDPRIQNSVEPVPPEDGKGQEGSSLCPLF
jgi:hypothetical protein